MSLFKHVLGKIGKAVHMDFFEDDSFDPDYDWGDIVFHRENLDIHDPMARKEYIRGTLEQLSDAERELNQLQYEYGLVTSHLTDIEELESLPDDMRRDIRESAMLVSDMEEEQVEFQRKSRMDEEQFLHMEKLAGDMPQGIGKLREAEEYRKKVKSDLRRLNSENVSCNFRIHELERETENYIGMAKICFGAIALCMLVLFCMQIWMGFDTKLGYVLVVCVMALVITVLYTRHNEALREMSRSEKELNRIIVLQNTVKIRYVNNQNLLDYLLLKYQVENADQLQKLWDDYLEEMDDRERYLIATRDCSLYQKELLKKLRHARVHDTSVWLHQARALVDAGEMVELRHKLITQRQHLRDQMDHNRQLAQMARDEIKDISEKYPEYAAEILHMMDIFQQN